MEAGKLRQTCTIQARPAQADSYNQKSGDWADIDNLAGIWCNIQDLTGLELVRAQKIVATATERIIIWGFPGWRQVITPACRAISGTVDTGQRIFDIKAIINPDGVDIELQLLCVEII